jgi:hypothetical protein
MDTRRRRAAYYIDPCATPLANRYVYGKSAITQYSTSMELLSKILEMYEVLL